MAAENGTTRREELLDVATKLFAARGTTAPGWTMSPRWWA